MEKGKLLINAEIWLGQNSTLPLKLTNRYVEKITECVHKLTQGVMDNYLKARKNF